MSKKWTNKNLAGVLHYVTGNVDKRREIFRSAANCIAFLEELQSMRQKHESRLICFVLMLDHFHLIINLRDGNIRSWIQELKSVSARRLVSINPPGLFRINDEENQVWQESFNTVRLWSGWMIWQKINYIHNNPLKAGLVDSASDYRWSSFRSFYNRSPRNSCPSITSGGSRMTWRSRRTLSGAVNFHKARLSHLRMLLA